MTLRRLWTIAWFDLLDSLRSRRAIALLVLYVAGSAAASLIFVRVMREVENASAGALAVSGTDKPGAMTDQVMQSEQFRAVITGLLGDAAMVDALLTIPPMALFYGWLSLMFLPPLIMLTSADAISSELQSGEARYALVRVDRLTWAVGKLGGQAQAMGIGIALGGLAVYLVGLFGWAGFAPVATGWWLVRLSGRAFVYGFCWLGIALGISQLTGSGAIARGVGLVSLVVVGIVTGLLGSVSVVGIPQVVGDTLVMLLPGGYEMGLWRPELGHRAFSALMLAALGVLYFSLGHRRLAARDV